MVNRLDVVLQFHENANPKNCSLKLKEVSLIKMSNHLDQLISKNEEALLTGLTAMLAEKLQASGVMPSNSEFEQYYGSDFKKHNGKKAKAIRQCLDAIALYPELKVSQLKLTILAGRKPYPRGEGSVTYASS